MLLDDQVHQANELVSSYVVEDNDERRKWCQCHWQNYIFNKVIQFTNVSCTIMI